MKKKTKQTQLHVWTTASSGTTSTNGVCYPMSVSGSVTGWDIDTKTPPLKEDQEIEITLQDGTEVTITLKDYMQFVAYNKMVPSDCKDLDEFNEKMLVFRI